VNRLILLILNIFHPGRPEAIDKLKKIDRIQRAPVIVFELMNDNEYDQVEEKKMSNKHEYYKERYGVG
jgi:hypothetical protein